LYGKYELLLYSQMGVVVGARKVKKHESITRMKTKKFRVKVPSMWTISHVINCGQAACTGTVDITSQAAKLYRPTRAKTWNNWSGPGGAEEN